MRITDRRNRQNLPAALPMKKAAKRTALWCSRLQPHIVVLNAIPGRLRPDVPNRALTLLRRLIDYGKLARCLISLLVAPGDQLRRVFAYNSFINESIAFARSRTQRSGLF